MVKRIDTVPSIALYVNREPEQNHRGLCNTIFENRYVHVHAFAVVRMLSVVLGRCLHSYHMVDHELAHENQWAYKQGNSTEMAKRPIIT